MKYEVYFKDYLEKIENALGEMMPPEGHYPPELHDAMRYAVFTGGKRFRPVLTLAACEAAGGKVEDALYPAAALEFIHCSSLVHDDLPALDNDELRRGKPTCHKRFGEATAILAGDALLILAFQVCSKVHSAMKAQRLAVELSTASGSCGMIAGQAAELAAGDANLDLPTLEYISIHKTGKLIKASAVCGAITADANKDIYRRMFKFGEWLGLAFQSIDDLMDGDGYLKLMKAKELRQKVRDLIANAKREIKPLGNKADKLQVLADFLIRRMPRGPNVSVDR